MIFDVQVQDDEEFVVTQLVRDLAGIDDADIGRIEDARPLNQHLYFSEAFFQPPAVIKVAFSARRMPSWELSDGRGRQSERWGR